MRLLFLLIISVFASENEKTVEKSELNVNSSKNSKQNEILVKIEEDECTKVIIYEIRMEFENVSKCEG